VTHLEIIFVGLSAIVIDQEIKSNDGYVKLPPYKTKTLEAYLLADEYHDAELWIRTDAIGAINNKGPNGSPCDKKHSSTPCANLSGSYGACTDQFPYKVFCIEKTDVVFPKLNGNKRFYAGTRPKGNGKFYGNEKTENDSQKLDLSWVPEAAKAWGAGKLIDQDDKFDAIVTTKVRGLNGDLRAIYSDTVWDWCEPNANKCTDMGTKYRQAFAKSAALSTKTNRSIDILLVHAETTVPIDLKPGVAHLYIHNAPTNPDDVLKEVDGKCVVPHFEKYGGLVDLGGKKVRIPWLKNSCNSYVSKSIADSFCPPIILQK